MLAIRAYAASLLVCFLSTALLAGGFSAAQSFRTATPEELAMKSPGDAPAVILDWVRVDDDTDGLDSEYYRIKIFSEEGKRYGNIEEPYFASYPLFTKVTDISARTMRPDGTVVPFDGKVYDKTLIRVGRQALNAKAFSLPDVQPGSIIEYRFIRRSTREFLVPTLWSVQRDLPILHCRLTLKPYAGKEFTSYFMYMGLPEGVKPVKSGDHYDLELHDVPAFRHEEFAPPEDQLKPRVNFFYTTSRVRPEEFWQNESQVTSKRIESFIGNPSALRDEATAAIAGLATPGDQVKALYARVQSLRNLTFDPDASERPAARNAAAVLKAGAGSSEEINRVFVALARAAGFDADVVRVAPREKFFFSDKLPDADQMNDEVAVVTVDGKPVVVDPGSVYAPFAIVAWPKTGVPAYRVTKRGPQWIKTPETPATSAILQRRADLRLDGESLKGTITVSFTGQEALKRRIALAGTDEAAKKRSIQDEVSAWLPAGSQLSLTALSGLTTSVQTATATFDVELPNAVSHAGSRLLVPASLFTTRNANPFAPASRTYPIYFEYPRQEEDEVKITVPNGMSIAGVPEATTLDAGAVGYKSEVSRNGATVTFKRTMFVDTIFVDLQYYPALRRFFTSVASADAKPFVLQSAN